MHMFAHMSIHMSVHISIHISIHMSIHIYIQLYIQVVRSVKPRTNSMTTLAAKVQKVDYTHVYTHTSTQMPMCISATFAKVQRVAKT